MAGAIAAPAAAQTFPDRPLRIVVAFSTGTAADIVARQIALKLTDSLGKQVVVENRDGAAGTLGAGLVVRATPDGHTMLIASPSIIVSPLLIAKALQAPDVTQRFLNLGGDIVSGGPEELAKAMRGGTQKWGRLVKEIDSQRK